MLLELQNNKIYNHFYKYLSNEYLNNEFELNIEIFNLLDNDILDKYSKKIKNSNILLNIYLISWITEIYNIYTNDQEINLNESSNNILFSNKNIQIFIIIFINIINNIIVIFFIIIIVLNIKSNII